MRNVNVELNNIFNMLYVQLYRLWLSEIIFFNKKLQILLITKKTIDELRVHIFPARDWLLHETGWGQTGFYGDKGRRHIPFLQ